MPMPLRVWRNKGLGVDEECLLLPIGDYVGIKTGTVYPRSGHYHSEQLRGRIRAADSTNQTGMYHLYTEQGTGDENRQGYKRQLIGCEVTLERAHRFGETEVFWCVELEEYFSQHEVELGAKHSAAGLDLLERLKVMEHLVKEQADLDFFTARCPHCLGAGVGRYGKYCEFHGEKAKEVAEERAAILRDIGDAKLGGGQGA